MSIKALFFFFALAEAGVALLLMLWPAAVAKLLFAAALNGPTALLIGRVAGVALLSLVIACWIARNAAAGPAAWRPAC